MTRSEEVTAEVRKVLEDKEIALARLVEVDLVDLQGGGRLEIVAVGSFKDSLLPTQPELQEINDILVEAFGDSLDSQYTSKTGRIVAPPIVSHRHIPAQKLMLFTIGDVDNNFLPDADSLKQFRNLLNEAMRRAGSTMTMAIHGAEPAEPEELESE